VVVAPSSEFLSAGASQSNRGGRCAEELDGGRDVPLEAKTRLLPIPFLLSVATPQFRGLELVGTGAARTHAGAACRNPLAGSVIKV